MHYLNFTNKLLDYLKCPASINEVGHFWRMDILECGYVCLNDGIRKFAAMIYIFSRVFGSCTIAIHACQPLGTIHFPIIDSENFNTLIFITKLGVGNFLI